MYEWYVNYTAIETIVLTMYVNQGFNTLWTNQHVGQIDLMVGWHSKYLERTFMCNGFVIIMTELSLRMSSQGVRTLTENINSF